MDSGTATSRFWNRTDGLWAGSPIRCSHNSPVHSFPGAHQTTRPVAPVGLFVLHRSSVKHPLAQRGIPGASIPAFGPVLSTFIPSCPLSWYHSAGDCGFVPVITWGFPGGSAGEESTCNVGDLGSVPELGKSPGEGKGYPLQYSDLENSMEKSMGSQRVRHYWATFTSPVITWASPYSWLDGDSLRAGALSELTGERRVSPGKGGGGGLVAKSCPDSCDPVACSPPGSSVRGILQARTLEWVAILQRGCPVIIRRMHFPW